MNDALTKVLGWEKISGHYVFVIKTETGSFLGRSRDANVAARMVRSVGALGVGSAWRLYTSGLFREIATYG